MTFPRRVVAVVVVVYCLHCQSTLRSSYTSEKEREGEMGKEKEGRELRDLFGLLE